MSKTITLIALLDDMAHGLAFADSGANAGWLPSSASEACLEHDPSNDFPVITIVDKDNEDYLHFSPDAELSIDEERDDEIVVRDLSGDKHYFTIFKTVSPVELFRD